MKKKNIKKKSPAAAPATTAPAAVIVETAPIVMTVEQMVEAGDLTASDLYSMLNMEVTGIEPEIEEFEFLMNLQDTHVMERYCGFKKSLGIDGKLTNFEVVLTNKNYDQGGRKLNLPHFNYGGVDQEAVSAEYFLGEFEKLARLMRASKGEESRGISHGTAFLLTYEFCSLSKFFGESKNLDYFDNLSDKEVRVIFGFFWKTGYLPKNGTRPRLLFKDITGGKVEKSIRTWMFEVEEKLFLTESMALRGQSLNDIELINEVKLVSVQDIVETILLKKSEDQPLFYLKSVKATIWALQFSSLFFEDIADYFKRAAYDIQFRDILNILATDHRKLTRQSEGVKNAHLLAQQKARAVSNKRGYVSH